MLDDRVVPHATLHKRRKRICSMHMRLAVVFSLAAIATVMAATGLFAVAPASALPPRLMDGDADCDGIVSSVDAAVILQANAGLLSATPCPEVADVNFDYEVDSLDAAIVLQMVADLCCPQLAAELSTVSIPAGVPFAHPVEMSLAVTNPGDTPVTRRYNSGQSYDFIVRNQSDAIVWQWSFGMAFTEAIEHRTWAPGETVTYSAVWNQVSNGGNQAPAGPHTVTGRDVGCSLTPPRACDLGQKLEFYIVPPP